MGVKLMNFKENIKNIRRQNNLTQQQLANALNVSLESIRNYEQGKREPNFIALEKIKNYFNCSYDDLLK